MTAISPGTAELLDFLCAIHAAPNVRVKRLKGTALHLSWGKLVKSGLIRPDSFEPTAWAMHDWRVRQDHPKFNETPARLHAESTEPPEPKAAAEEGGDARKVAPPSTAPHSFHASETTPAELLTEVLAYCQQTGTAPTKVGLLAVNDLGLVNRLKRSRTISQATVIKVRAITQASQPRCCREATELHAEINKFLERTGISKGRFGLLAFGSPSWVNTLKTVKRLSPQKLATARAFMADPPERAFWRSIWTNPAANELKQQNTEGTSGAHGGGRERAPEGGTKIREAESERSNGPNQQRKRGTPDTPASTVSSRQREVTPRSVGCDEGASGGAKPIPGDAGPTFSEPSIAGPHPSVEPSLVAPKAVESVVEPVYPVPVRPALEEPKPVDIKVNGRRDPTQKPEMPFTELRDRQVMHGHRHAAAVRRGREQNATALVDAGVNPASQNSMVCAQMHGVMRRREEEARLADPVEQAKTIIRSRARLPVFNADVTIGDRGKGKFFIGNRLVDKDELLAFARRWTA